MFKATICILILVVFASAWNYDRRDVRLNNNYRRNSINNKDGIVFAANNRNGGNSGFGSGGYSDDFTGGSWGGRSWNGGSWDHSGLRRFDSSYSH